MFRCASLQERLLSGLTIAGGIEGTTGQPRSCSTEPQAVLPWSERSYDLAAVAAGIGRNPAGALPIPVAQNQCGLARILTSVGSRVAHAEEVSAHALPAFLISSFECVPPMSTCSANTLVPITASASANASLRMVVAARVGHCFPLVPAHANCAVVFLGLSKSHPNLTGMSRCPSAAARKVLSCPFTNELLS